MHWLEESYDVQRKKKYDKMILEDESYIEIIEHENSKYSFVVKFRGETLCLYLNHTEKQMDNYSDNTKVISAKRTAAISAL